MARKRRNESRFHGMESLIEFLSRYYIITGSAEDQVTRPHLYAHYTQFCQAHYLPVASIINMGMYLGRKGVVAKTRVGG